MDNPTVSYINVQIYHKMISKDWQMHCITRKQNVEIPMESSSLQDLGLKEDTREGCRTSNKVGFSPFFFDEMLPFQLTSCCFFLSKYS